MTPRKDGRIFSRVANIVREPNFESGRRSVREGKTRAFQMGMGYAVKLKFDTIRVELVPLVNYSDAHG